MNTASQKPKTGVLKYGNKIVDQDKPFRDLQILKKQLIASGYDKSLFHLHYYYADNK
jgi:hypothetical protein